MTMTTPSRAEEVEQLAGEPKRVPDELLMCYSGCGCPHEEWDYLGATFALHKDDGLPVQTFVLVDEGEIELPDMPSFIEAKEQACKWIDEHIIAEVN